jgi:hypothetical protein
MPSRSSCTNPYVATCYMVEKILDQELDAVLNEVNWRSMEKIRDVTKPVLAFRVKNGQYLGSIHIPHCRCPKCPMNSIAFMEKERYQRKLSPYSRLKINSSVEYLDLRFSQRPARHFDFCECPTCLKLMDFPRLQKKIGKMVDSKKERIFAKKMNYFIGAGLQMDGGYNEESWKIGLAAEIEWTMKGWAILASLKNGRPLPEKYELSPSALTLLNLFEQGQNNLEQYMIDHM